jgi:hypothetical protein
MARLPTCDGLHAVDRQFGGPLLAVLHSEIEIADDEVILARAVNEVL